MAVFIDISSGAHFFFFFYADEVAVEEIVEL